MLCTQVKNTWFLHREINPFVHFGLFIIHSIREMCFFFFQFIVIIGWVARKYSWRLSALSSSEIQISKYEILFIYFSSFRSLFVWLNKRRIKQFWKFKWKPSSSSSSSTSKSEYIQICCTFITYNSYIHSIR